MAPLANTGADLHQRATVLLEEAKTILTNEQSGAEDVQKANKMIEEAKGLKDRAAKLADIQMTAETLETPAPEKKSGKPQGELTWKEFVVALAKKRRTGFVDPRLHHFDDPDADAALDGAGRSGQKAMAEAAGATGGFLVSTENYASLMSVAAPMSVVRPRATVIPMGKRQILIPVLDQTGTTAGEAHFFGGIEVFWQAESSQKGESQPNWRQAALTAHELVGYTVVSDALLEDADVSLAAWLSGPLGFPGAIAWAEDYAFLRGTGVGQPQGVIGAPATIVVPRVATVDIRYDDLVKIAARHMGPNPVWIATQLAKEKLLLMTGPTGNPAYLWGNAQTGAPATLLGYPIVFVDKLPGVGTQGDIGLYDFSYYVVGDRRVLTVDSSIHVNFRNNQTAFRAVHRVDGQPWLSAPITYQDGTTQVSPFVVLGDKTT